MKRREKQTKEDQEQVKDFEERASGQRNSQKNSTNRVPLFTVAVSGRFQHERHVRFLNPKPHFELRFRTKALSLSKLNVWKRKISRRVLSFNPQFATISGFEQN